MPKEHILVVDDEEDILELVSFNLIKQGYQVSVAESGEKAIEITEEGSIDLMILDLMLPGMNGLEVTNHLKSNTSTSDIPIIMLTAKGEEADIVKGLELGADDYVSKPFSPKVLLARIKAVLRRKIKEVENRSEAQDLDIIKLDNIVIHLGRHQVTVDNKNIELTLSEFHLLCFLVKKPGWVFTRSQIVDAIHGEGYAVTDRSVDVQIAGLRKKLGQSGKYIETVRGVGYRFKE